MNSDNSLVVARHPIGVVAERTGLSQDVIRVWERRYGAVEPPRGDGGQRRYSDADIHRLQLLHAATRSGRSISHVAKLALSVLEQLVAEDKVARDRIVRDHAPVPSADEEFVQPAMAFTVALDGPGLESLLRRAVSLLGIPPFLEHIVAPFLRRIGVDWHAGRLNPAQEHLASATVLYVLAEITRAAGPAHASPAILITTPSGERHQIGAVLAGATASAAGWRVIYLGPDLPAADIARAAVDTGVRVVAVSVVFVEDRRRTVSELRALRAALPAGTALLAGGAGAIAVGEDLAGSGIEVIRDLSDLHDALGRDRLAGT